MNRFVVAALAIGMAGAFAAGEAASEPLKVQFGTLSISPFVFPHYAKEKGYYEAEGIEVELIPGRLSQDAVNAVASGSADIAFALGVNAILTRDKGQDIVVVGNMYGRNGFGVAMGKETGVEDLKGLAGHTVVVPAASYEQLLRALMESNGGDPSQVEFVTVSQINAMLNAYIAKQVDGAATLMPFVLNGAEAQRPANYIPFADYGDPEPMYVWIARPETIEARRGEIEAFLRATYRAQAEINANPEIMVETQMKAAPGTNPDTVVPEYNLYIPYACAPGTDRLGVASPEAWAEAVALYKRIGLATSDMKPEDLYTNAFFEGDNPVTTAKCN